MSYYKAENVRPVAEGNWLYVIGALAPHAELALKKAGRHVPCPIHGGKDGFRLFKDVSRTGGGVCNSCGTRHDGFELLMWLNNWDFKTTLEAVGDFLGVEKTQYAKANSNVANFRSKATARVVGNTVTKGDDVIPFDAPPAKVQTVFKEHTEAKTLPNQQWLDEVKARLDKQVAMEAENNARLVKRIPEIWNESIVISSSSASPVHRYFEKRGLVFKTDTLSDTGLKFHPCLSYYDSDGKKVGDFPAMIASIRDVSGKVITLHRTYLQDNGKKASVDNVKKMMTVPTDLQVQGGAIQLGTAGEVLGIAEGIETALAVRKATGITCWSAVNAVLLEAFEPPKQVKKVIIWADKDKSHTGLLSANKLKARLEEKGIEVLVALPAMPIPKKAKSVDWNDVLEKQGILGFPSFKAK